MFFPPLARPLGTRIRGVAADSEGGRLVPRADRVDEVVISARGAVASGPGFGWDRSGALELACGGMLSDGGMCAGSPGGRSPVRFPGVCRRGKAGFWRSVEVEEEASAGRKQRGGSFAAGWGTETDPVHAGGRSRLTPIVFDTGRAPLICDGLMVASRRRDPAAVCASRRNSGTAGRSSDYRIFTNFVHPSRVRWFCSLLRCKWKLPVEASQGGVLESLLRCKRAGRKAEECFSSVEADPSFGVARPQLTILI